MFLSFRFLDAKPQYVHLKKKYLAIVKCLSEVKWLLIGSPYPIIICLDHQALADIFYSEKAQINIWLDCLSEFDPIVCHQYSCN